VTPEIDAAGIKKHVETDMKLNTRKACLTTILALLAGTVSALAHGETTPGENALADKVRAANSRFQDVSVAAAEGYVPIPCASNPNGSGAMGIHYVNAKYLGDDAIDLARPEAVMYEPMPDGSRTLVAVEYITSKGAASLEGQLFSFTSAPNRYGLGPFYELHVWAWKANPTGTFSDMNPDVSCAFATPATQ
jgi:hypothetical protein